jgi:hypothetical protein
MRRENIILSANSTLGFGRGWRHLFSTSGGGQLGGADEEVHQAPYGMGPGLVGAGEC